MLITLAISKDRVPYILEELGTDRVTVKETPDSTTDEISFYANGGARDFLCLFHAGIKCGSGRFKEIEEKYKLQKP
jgi:hypothetical protein